MILEACVDNIEDALEAQKKGAHQIELCARLDLDGLTPSEELIRECLNQLSIPIHAMIRPRGGNFVHDRDEIESMKQEIYRCKSLGVKGVVFGVLNQDNSINIEATKELSEHAKPLTITFHKAIDSCTDIFSELTRLKELNLIDQVLTSGGAATAEEGAITLNKMVQEAAQIEIKVAGKVTQNNLQRLKDLTGATLFHGKKIV